MKDNKGRLTYDDGFKEGYNKGIGDGQNKGYEKGYRIGMDIGSNKGYKDGYEYGFEKGYREGHNLGYNMGFLAGLKEKDIRYHQGYEIGYQKGFDSAFNKLSNFAGRLVDSRDVYSLIKNAYVEGKGFTLVRLEHKDLLQLENEGYEGQEFILEVFKRASIVGIPTSQIPEYQLHLLEILEKVGFKLEELIITDANINYALLIYDFMALLIKEKIKIGILLKDGENSLKGLEIQGLNIVGEVYLEEGQKEGLAEEINIFNGSSIILNFCGINGIKYLWNNTNYNKLIILDLGDAAGYLMERTKNV